MRIRTRILLVVAFAAVVPVAISAWTSLGIHQRAFDDQLAKLRVQAAQFGADLSHRDLEGKIAALAGLAQRSSDWARLTPPERERAQWLLFGQLDDVAAVAVIQPDGKLASKPSRLAAGQAEGTWARHLEIDEQTVTSFLRQVRPGAAASDSPVVGAPFAAGDHVFIPISFRVPGESSDQPWLVAVALSTRSLCTAFLRRRPVNTRAYLLDASGARICADGGGGLRIGPEVVLAEDGHSEYRTPDERSFLAAMAVNPTGWRAVIAQDATLAEAPKKEIRQRILFWVGIGLLGAYLAGIVLSVGIARPIQNLEQAAAKVASGDFDHHISLNSRDEVGELARAFNLMSAEIKSWRDELHSRVEERTRELKAAQDQLLDARKLAAMASLSAGVAHEINNPLTAVLALTQVLARKAERGDVKNAPSILASIEKEAQRIAEIIETMRALDESEHAGFMDHNLNDVISSITDKYREQAEHSGLTFTVELGRELPAVYCNSERLARAISNLVDNGIKATRAGSVIIKSRHVDGELVIVEISDTGRGIPEDIQSKIFEPFFTTKDDWRGTGMGLAVAHQIITKHNGRVSVDSTVGQGSTFTVSFPATHKRAHLV